MNDFIWWFRRRETWRRITHLQVNCRLWLWIITPAASLVLRLSAELQTHSSHSPRGTSNGLGLVSFYRGATERPDWKHDRLMWFVDDCSRWLKPARTGTIDWSSVISVNVQRPKEPQRQTWTLQRAESTGGGCRWPPRSSKSPLMPLMLLFETSSGSLISPSDGSSLSCLCHRPLLWFCGPGELIQHVEMMTWCLWGDGVRLVVFELQWIIKTVQPVLVSLQRSVIILRLYLCARGLTSLKSFHLYLGGLIPGESQHTTAALFLQQGRAGKGRLKKSSPVLSSLNWPLQAPVLHVVALHTLCIFQTICTYFLTF